MNNQAPELSTEARRIISEARGVDDPTADDQARVKARWLASVAAVAGVSSLTEAARAAGGIGWGLKAAGAALVLAAGAIGLYVALPTDVARAPAAKRAEAPEWSGTTHARFEKTPPGEQRSLEQAGRVPSDSSRGNSPGQLLPASNRAPAEYSLVPAAPVISAPVISAPVVSSPPSSVVQAAPTAPSVLEPAEVPVLGGNALDTGVDAPATGVTVASPSPAAAATEAPVGPVAAAAPSDTKPARRERVPSRATAPPAHAAKPAPVAEGRAAEAKPPATAANPAPSGQLGEELALLSDVRSSIQGATPERALELLGHYRSRFGRPILGMEADALRVDALCKAGRRDAAQASARAFQNDWPGSPLEQRVSAACP